MTVGRVVAATFAFFRMADDQGNTLDTASQVIQCLIAGPVEIRAQQQVFRRGSHTTPVPA